MELTAFFIGSQKAASLIPQELADRDALLEQALQNYNEPVPGAKARVKQVLQVMLTAWLAARMQQEAEKMLNKMKI